MLSECSMSSVAESSHVMGAGVIICDTWKARQKSFLTPSLLFSNLIDKTPQFSSVQFSSVSQLCPTLCDSMNRSTPGLPVHHQLPESTQTHVHRVGNAIQPSPPLLSPSPLALNLFQHQGLFK